MKPLARLLFSEALCLWIAAAAIAAERESILSTEAYQRLKAHVVRLRLVDTHEHLSSEAAYLKRPADFLVTMLHYVESDLVSAGMPRGTEQAWLAQVQVESVPFAERWGLFMKHWPDVRFTGYGRALEWCTRDLYGVDLGAPLTPQLGEELNRRLAEARKPGFYRRILKEKARIDLSIVDIGTTQVDREFFAPVLRFDDFVTPSSRKDLERLSQRTGVEIQSLDDLTRALAVAFEKGVRDGMIGIKSGLAYSRRIHYPLPTAEEARAAFARVAGEPQARPGDTLALQNYMMHEVCKLAARHRKPFQIHTGLQTGFGNRITNSKPTDLVDLTMAHPDVKFALFHGGYPYGSELATMAKNFANVYIDLCWLHIISPKVARESLAEWIETVPANKLLGFGGDYLFVEGAYAHAEMARQNVAMALAQKVVDGYLGETEAAELAERLLRRNAIALFNLTLN